MFGALPACSLAVLLQGQLGHLPSFVHVSLFKRFILLALSCILRESPLLFFQLLFNFDNEEFSHQLFLVLFVIKDVAKDFFNLLKDSLLALVSINLLQKIVLTVLNTERCEPFAQGSLLEVEADHAIDECAIVIPVLIDGF